MKTRQPQVLKLRRKYEIDESAWLVRFWGPRLRKARLFIEWRGFPKTYEFSFVMKMKDMEAKGLSFEEILKATTPKLFGEVPAQVLLHWIGRRAQQKPKLFAKTLNAMFGRSSELVLNSLVSLVDPDALLESKKPSIPAYQYLVEAMISKGMIET